MHVFECQEVLIPGYLYILAALCVTLAAINAILICVCSFVSWCLALCCWKERPADLQVLRMSA